MKVFRTRAEWLAIRPSQTTLGFVPTMGALHAGHLALVNQALRENAEVVVSIYVNPTQFDNPEDLSKYPVTFEEDCARLRDAGCHYLFAPSYDSLYPDRYRYRISETEISQMLEGAHRPGHFNGMLTVVLKLLNVIGADAAYFGEKDFQQLMLVKGMAEALQLPTKIIACPTVREADGLAMSSRNRRLSTTQRALAAQWARILADEYLSCDEARHKLEALGFRVDYIAEHWGRRLGAVHVPQDGSAASIRLIDNVLAVGKSPKA